MLIHRLALLTICGLCWTTTASAGFPVCASASSDPDGDGWGWENNASCRVASEPPTTSQVPTCNDNSTDPDGDGWGWENNQSCRVDTTTDNQPTPQPPSETPACASAQSDPDNDGWGWENNQSCRVVTDDNTDPAPPPVRTRVVMAVGDSITHGFRGQASYRKPLTNLLNQRDCQYRFVGSQSTNFESNVFTGPHESYSGHKADHFLTGHTSSAGVNRGIAHSMSSYDPDIILLHIGSNDMKTDSVSSTLAEIDQIIALIHQHDPATEVLLANLIPWLRDDTNTKVQQLGDQIEAYVAQLGSSRVHLVDVRSGFTRSMLAGDLIHPNATGDAHIADAFFDVYVSRDLCQ